MSTRSVSARASARQGLGASAAGLAGPAELRQAQHQPAKDGNNADNMEGVEHDTNPILQAAVLNAGEVEPSAAQREAAMQQQLAAMQQMMQQQALLMQQQAQQLQELRASPAHSPRASPQASPLASPAASPRQEPQAAAIEVQSRFARKEPRAQDLREYDGAAGAKLDEWLQELALATFLYKLNTLEATSFAVSRLRGAALQWWLALSTAQQEAAQGDTKALGAALRVRFQPVTAARSAREQLDRLQQGNRDVNEYIADFQRLHTQLHSMGEEDALYAFERGLRRELVEKLRVHGVQSLQEAIAMAARVGGLLQASRPAAASAHQMDIDHSEGVEERITRSVLNALQAQGSSSSQGFGAKAQTQRGYQQERNSRAPPGTAGNRGRFGGRSGGPQRGPPVVPGVPAEIVRQRLDAQQCVRCGAEGHRSPACPNAISALGN